MKSGNILSISRDALLTEQLAEGLQQQTDWSRDKSDVAPQEAVQHTQFINKFPLFLTAIQLTCPD